MTTQLLPRFSFGAFDPARGDRPPDALRIMCVLPTLNPYGGVVSVVNALNILIDQGHHATLVSLSRHNSDLVFPKTEPIYLQDWDNLPTDFTADFDVYLATSWETVPIIVEMATGNPKAVTLYYVQDFEPDFYGEDETEIRQRALATYSMIENRFVKTEHLQRKLAEHGFEATVIPPGMNLDIFYPRSGPPSTRAKRIVAMARPTPDDHRGYEVLIEVFRQIAHNHPEIDLVMFGTDDLPQPGFAVENLGRVRPSELPDLYSSCQIFLDTSRFHGFGRTGAEALACRTAVVLSDSGGISSYARHDENALIVPVGDVAATVAAIEALLAHPERMDRLAVCGLETVSGLSDYVATARIEELFREALG
jgi:glycosyltransferase involved in cell wall biosynthesis